MIYYLSTERFSDTARRYIRNRRTETRNLLRSVSYEEVFFEKAAPIGHYIFTDFDRLSRYELECAVVLAKALKQAAPDARVLNHPLKALERYPLLIALHNAGINDFTATRLEAGVYPPMYPVFIRAEDGYGGPETELINDDAGFDAALEDLVRRGLPKKGRIAIGFANELRPDGYFHKFGAFNIAGQIVPHDRLYGRHWAVKFYASPDGSRNQDEEYGQSEAGVARELEYIKTNPHQEVLRRVFAIAGIEFGRADYGIVNGKVQIYEINTNPNLPYSSNRSNRWERRIIVKEGLLRGFNNINQPIGTSGRFRFELPRPKAHNLHWPRQRIIHSLARRATDIMSGKTRRQTR